jgi:hypothetical protein
VALEAAMSRSRRARIYEVVREELGEEICPVVERAMVALIEAGHSGLAQELNAARWTADRLRGALVGLLMDEVGRCPCQGRGRRHHAKCRSQRLRARVRALEGA